MKKDAVMNGTGQAAEPIVRIRGLRKSFGSHVVLSGIDFDVLPSQVVVVIGPSGSGKSTFLRCCNGLEQPEGGHCGDLRPHAGAGRPHAARP